MWLFKKELDYLKILYISNPVVIVEKTTVKGNWRIPQNLFLRGFT
jgi:hypothetical protein